MGFMLVSGCTSLLRRTWNTRDSPVKVSLCNLFCLFPSGTVSTGEEISFSFNVLSLTTKLDLANYFFQEFSLVGKLE